MIEPLDEGDEITAEWLEDLVGAVRAATVVPTHGGDILADVQDGGTVLRLNDLARFQMRPVLVETQAAAATTVVGRRRAGIGYFYWLVPQVVNNATDPNTFDFGQATNAVRVPFYNLYTSGASAAAGKLVWVAPLSLGWILVANEC